MCFFQCRRSVSGFSYFESVVALSVLSIIMLTSQAFQYQMEREIRARLMRARAYYYAYEFSIIDSVPDNLKEQLMLKLQRQLKFNLPNGRVEREGATLTIRWGKHDCRMKNQRSEQCIIFTRQRLPDLR